VGSEYEEEDTLGFGDDLDLVFRGPAPRLRSPEDLKAQFPFRRTNLKCPDCGAKLVLKDGKFGIFYGCEKYAETGCKGSHNCHKNTAEPLGIPADSDTRKARREAHEVFDQLWRDQGLGKMSRQAAYQWMQTHLKLSEEDAHIARLDRAGCERLIKAVNRFLHPPNRFERDDPI